MTGVLDVTVGTAFGSVELRLSPSQQEEWNSKLADLPRSPKLGFPLPSLISASMAGSRYRDDGSTFAVEKQDSPREIELSRKIYKVW